MIHLILTIVSSRIDCCNLALAGLPQRMVILLYTRAECCSSPSLQAGDHGTVTVALCTSLLVHRIKLYFIMQSVFMEPESVKHI